MMNKVLYVDIYCNDLKAALNLFTNQYISNFRFRLHPELYLD